MNRFSTVQQESDRLDARRALLDLMATRPSSTLRSLHETTGLSEPLLEYVLMQLLTDGLINREFHGSDPRAAAYTLHQPGDSQDARSASSIDSRIDRRILDCLSRRPSTALQVSAELHLPLTQVRESLNALHRRGFVGCRYVGWLNIYRTAN